MLKFVDYYRAKKSLITPIGIIPEGAIGNRSQYGDVIRFEGISNDGDPMIITAFTDKVVENEELFEIVEGWNE